MFPCICCHLSLEIMCGCYQNKSRCVTPVHLENGHICALAMVVGMKCFILNGITCHEFCWSIYECGVSSISFLHWVLLKIEELWRSWNVIATEFLTSVLVSTVFTSHICCSLNAFKIKLFIIQLEHFLGIYPTWQNFVKQYYINNTYKTTF